MSALFRFVTNRKNLLKTGVSVSVIDFNFISVFCSFSAFSEPPEPGRCRILLIRRLISPPDLYSTAVLVSWCRQGEGSLRKDGIHMNCNITDRMSGFCFRTAAFLLFLLCLVGSGCAALPVSLAAERSPYADLENSVYALKHWIQDARIPDEKGIQLIEEMKETLKELEPEPAEEAWWIQGGKKIMDKKDLHDGEAIWCYGDSQFLQGEFEDGISLRKESLQVSFSDSLDEVLLESPVLTEQGASEFTKVKRLHSASIGASLASGASVEGRWDGLIEFASTGPDELVQGTMVYEDGLPVISGRAADGSWLIKGTGGFHVDDPYDEMYW